MWFCGGMAVTAAYLGIVARNERQFIRKRQQEGMKLLMQYLEETVQEQKSSA